MRFRTEIEPIRPPFALTPLRRGVLLGSCFSDEIGARMRAAMWDVAPNPCGVLFNPASITNTIALALSDNPQDLLRLHPAGTLTACMDFSTLFSTPTAEATTEKCLNALTRLRDYLVNADFLIVTFGTAWVYEMEGRTVANCHKLPADLFVRRMMSVEEIASIWQDVVERLREVNPELKIIYTVSPVRHTADTLHGNNLSKASLLLAVDRLTRDGDFYFPAYEMLIDDLRDYRFYADDMKHPSLQAVDYVWEHFLSAFVSTTDRETLKAATRLTRRLKHRSLSDSAEAERFQTETQLLLERFLTDHPYLKTR